MKIDPGSNPIQNVGVYKYNIQEKEEENNPDAGHLWEVDGKRVKSLSPFDLFHTKKTLEGDLQLIVIKKQGNGWIKIEDLNGDSQKIQISKKTAITLDGIEAELADLKEGDAVVVRVSGNKAVSLVATSTPLTLTGMLYLPAIGKGDLIDGIFVINGVGYPIAVNPTTVQVKINGIPTTFIEMSTDPRVIQSLDENGGMLVKAQFASNGTEIISFNVIL